MAFSALQQQPAREPANIALHPSYPFLPAGVRVPKRTWHHGIPLLKPQLPKRLPSIHILHNPVQLCCSRSHPLPLDPHPYIVANRNNSVISCAHSTPFMPPSFCTVLSVVWNSFCPYLLDELLDTLQDLAVIPPGGFSEDCSHAAPTPRFP